MQAGGLVSVMIVERSSLLPLASFSLFCPVLLHPQDPLKMLLLFSIMN